MLLQDMSDAVCKFLICARNIQIHSHTITNNNNNNNKQWMMKRYEWQLESIPMVHVPPHMSISGV